MSALVVLDQSEASGLRRVKVEDLILTVSLGGQIEVESGSVDLPSDRDVWVVKALRTNPTGRGRSEVQTVCWFNTQSKASEVAGELTQMGATCYPDLISAEPPTSAQ